jgi:osmotically-inducible protein OsmY
MIKEQAMNISYTKRILAICAYLGFAVYGLAGSVTRADTPNVAADEELRQRVTAALHSDPYFYDEHVNVSVEKGVVVLRGFVASESDLRDALRIAGKAAGDRRVVDDLSIVQGGRR